MTGVRADISFDYWVRRCNFFVWGCMWTDGYLLDEGGPQHADIIRTFFAAIYEVLMALDHKDLGEEYIAEYREMCESGWRPDERFFKSAPRG